MHQSVEVEEKGSIQPSDGLGIDSRGMKGGQPPNTPEERNILGKFFDPAPKQGIFREIYARQQGKFLGQQGNFGKSTPAPIHDLEIEDDDF